MNQSLASVYWMDGKMVRSDRAFLPLTDLMVTRGYGAFEALRTYQGRPFLLNEHLRRLSRTCRLLCLRMPIPVSGLRQVISETLSANRFSESLIRLYVSGGDASGFVPDGKSRLLVLVDAVRVFPPWCYEKGVKIKTTRLNRPIPLAKTVDYTAGIRETILAKKKGFHEVVFLDRRGNILEGTQFNVVAIRGNQLVTPDQGILPGITVEHVLKLGRKEGFSIRRAPISAAFLKSAEEVFITSTNREIIPVVRVDQLEIGSGRPGPVTRLLHQQYLKSTA